MRFPIPPLNSDDKNSRVWHLWFDQLRLFLSNTTGLIPWLNIDKTGSKLTDIQTRPHNDLQIIQGGTTGEAYHLTANQLTELTDGGDTTLHTHVHNNMISKQGGTTGEFFHLTDAEYDEVLRSNNVASVSANTSLDDTYRTVLVTATGKTITLPPASSDRIGHDWTVILGTDGYTDVARAGSDTLTLPEVSSTIRLDQKGTSVTLRCLTATSWGIA